MKTISFTELSSIKGGWADPEGCKDVQIVAAAFAMFPEEVTEYDWQMWNKLFDELCLGITG